jgi:ADP-heptose:LPS heptosyltransferase
MLCAVPAWRALRAAFPRAEIILIGLPWAREFAERFAHYFDSFVEFPGYPGLPEIVPALDQLPGFLSAVQAEHFDLAIQMHGCGTITNPLVASFGARDLAGFYKAGQFRPDASRFLIYPEELPETWRHLRLMEHLGIPLQREELEFPLFPEDWVALERIPEAQHLEAGGYVCIHPGARAALRRWPPEHFAAIADALAAEGRPIVLTGSAAEVELTGQVLRAMQAPAIDLAGKTSLGVLAALLRQSALLVCNDTGVSHLAAALKVPSVVVFHRLSDREGWPPRDRQRHRVVTGVQGVSPEDVLAQARDLLEQGEPASIPISARS